MRRVLAGLGWLALVLGGGFVTFQGIIGLWWTAPDNDGRSDTEIFGVVLPIKPMFVGLFITMVGVLALIGAWVLHQRWSNNRRT